MSVFFVGVTIAVMMLLRLRNRSVLITWGQMLGVVSFTSMSTHLFGLILSSGNYESYFTVMVWAGAFFTIPLAQVFTRGSVTLFSMNFLAKKPSVIVVSGEANEQAVNQLLDSDLKEYQVSGIVHLDDVHVSGSNGIADLGGLQNLPEFLHANESESLLIAVPANDYSRVKSVMNGSNVSTMVFPSGIADASANSDTPKTGMSSWRYERLKRLMDITIAGSALIVASPFIAVMAALIKIDSRGPVFFGQTRVGRHGNLFTMHKFRSMRQDAEEVLKQLQEENEAAGAMFKMVDDPRITRVGKIIRRLSLDEIPQLFDVLAGTMSIVGPRPPLTNEVATYKPSDFKRLEAVPGITGLWQVRRGSEIVFEEMVDLDIEYMRDWSVAMDMKIILGTIPAMLKGTGAY